MAEKKDSWSGITFGPGCRFLTIDSYVQEFKHIGLTAKGVRSLMKCLGVPALISPKGPLYNVDQVQIAMAAVSRIGQPDFVMPGTIQKEKGVVRKGTVTLDQESYREELEQVLTYLLWARIGPGTTSLAGLRKTASEAARRMLDAAMSLRAITEEYNDELERKLRSERAEVVLHGYEMAKKVTEELLNDGESGTRDD